MRQYITFGGAAYDKTIERIVTDAPRFGADDVRVYDDKFILDSEFYWINAKWWKHPDSKYDLKNRGFGWFIWKPYVMLHALERLQPGDVMLFTDADTYPIADLSPIYQRCVDDGGMMFFNALGCSHRHFCKRDTLVVMGMDEGRPLAVETPHAVARFMLFQAGRWICRQFLMEWLAYCLNPLANTFDRSIILPEYPDLHEPRCEQAILTNLVKKYGRTLYREACQAGAHLADTVDSFYPQIFVQVDNATDRSDVSGSKYRNVLP